VSETKNKAEPIIQIVDVSKHYVVDNKPITALNSVSLKIYKSEFLCIMGPSGSGKSTLFNQIGVLDSPEDGYVEFEGRNLFKMSESQQAWYRCNKLGYIFQSYNLIEVMNAMQNVSLPLIFNGVPHAKAEKRAMELLDMVEMQPWAHHLPEQLSGGQQQRVAIARALANTPAVILADEPTGNLDRTTADLILRLLKRLHEQLQLTIVCSTHDPFVRNYAQRVCVMSAGKIESVDSV